MNQSSGCESRTLKHRPWLQWILRALGAPGQALCSWLNSLSTFQNLGAETWRNLQQKHIRNDFERTGLDKKYRNIVSLMMFDWWIVHFGWIHIGFMENHETLSMKLWLITRETLMIGWKTHPYLKMGQHFQLSAEIAWHLIIINRWDMGLSKQG